MILETEKLGIGKIIYNSFVVLGKNIVVLFFLNLFLDVIRTAFTSLSFEVIGYKEHIRQVSQALLNQSTPPPMPSEMFSKLWIVYIMSAILLIVTFSLNLIVVAFVTEKTVKEQKVTFSETLNFAFPRISKVTRTNLKVLISSLPWILLFGIGVIIPLYKYQFAPYITALKHEQCNDPLRRSTELVQNQGCSIILLWLCLALIIGILNQFLLRIIYSDFSIEFISIEQLTNSIEQLTNMNYLTLLLLSIPSQLFPISQVILFLNLEAVESEFM